MTASSRTPPLAKLARAVASRAGGVGVWAGSALARAIVSPAGVGASYVLGLALWALRPAESDDPELGAQAHQIEAFVTGRFGGDISRVALAVLAAATAFGIVLGLAAAALLALRDRLHPASALASPTLGARCLRIVGLVAVLHAAFELWSMAHDPSLYADAWYARGGWRRTVHVLAADTLHPAGVVGLVVFATAAFLAGPRSRWPLWRERARDVLRFAQARTQRALQIGAATLGLGLLALLVGFLPSAHAHVPPDPRPNILILAADSLRADRLDPRTTPNLSALAERGTRFDKAYVSLPRTFPSWVSFLTGRHPHHHGIRSMFPRWEERARDFDALPERLGRAGWATGVVSDYAGDIFSRIDLGFGKVDVPEFDFRQLVRQRVLERETPLLSVLHSPLGRAAFPVLREMNDAADPHMLAKDAVRTMRSLEAKGPFFLVVFFSTAHFPYAAPAPYFRAFTDGAYRGRYKYDKPVGLGREAPADAADQAQVRALYDGAVLGIDDAARGVLDALESDGIAHNTIVVVTGDHGETLYDHGHGQGHGDHLFGDEGTHVPLVVFDPRSAATPHREGAIVRDVDLAPTLYAMTGVAPPSDLDGRSLAPAVAGKALAPALAYAETGLWFTEDIAGLPGDLRLPYPGIAQLSEVDTAHGDELVLQKAMRPLTIVAKHRMVRDDRYKLVYVPARAGVRWLLFDTQADPGEEHDVAAAHPDVALRLQGELWAWMRRDPAMTERGGYLVPRDAGTRDDVGNADVGLVRLGDATSAPERGAP